MNTPIYEPLNPFPYYEYMRTFQPVSFSEEQHAWSVFRFDDVNYVIKEHTLFSSRIFPPDFDIPIASSMFFMDEPRHKQLRSLVTQVFTPRSIGRLATRIEHMAHEVIDAALAANPTQIDVIDGIASPLPILVIAELLGIPASDRAQFRTWSLSVVSTVNNLDVASPETLAIQAEMGRYFAELIQHRRSHPADDLISGLLTAESEGHHLTEQELLGFCFLLLVAGSETTTNLIGNATLCFHEHNVMNLLRTQPNLLPSALEEVLRMYSPFPGTTRRTTATTVVGGQEIPAGAMVVASLLSANRDERKFTEPDTFRIDRFPDPVRASHIAFSSGIHYCLGAPLARLEGQIVFRALLTRLSDIGVDRSQPLEPVGGLMFGVRHIPISFKV